MGQEPPLEVCGLQVLCPGTFLRVSTPEALRGPTPIPFTTPIIAQEPVRLILLSLLVRQVERFDLNEESRETSAHPRMATAFNVKGNDKLGALLQPLRPGLFKEERSWWHFGSGIRKTSKLYAQQNIWDDSTL